MDVLLGNIERDRQGARELHTHTHKEKLKRKRKRRERERGWEE